MFALALRTACAYTHPVILSTRDVSGEITSGCGTFIVINRDGYILTAAHVLRPYNLAKDHEKERGAYEEEVRRIRSDHKMNAKQKARAIKQLPYNPKWICNSSFWWSRDGVSVKTFAIDQQADLAVGKLEPYDEKWNAQYPTFRNPSNPPEPGDFLCRLGFPLHKIKPIFHEDTNAFELPPETFPIPFFPKEGMYTREAQIVDLKTSRIVKFIEMSTPGLRGQSGGPILDSQGRICAMQSQTGFHPMGFSPKVIRGNREVEEHQFLGTGLGTHVDEIVRLFKTVGISYDLST